MKGTIRHMMGGVVQRNPASPMPGGDLFTRFKQTVRAMVTDESGRVELPVRGSEGDEDTRTLDELQTAYRAAVDSANAILEAVGDGALSPEQRRTLRTANDEATQLEELIADRQGDDEIVARSRQRRDELNQRRQRAQNTPALYGDGDPVQPDDDVLTPGEAFVRSSEYEAWIQRYPSGAPGRGQAQSESVHLAHMRATLGMRSATERIAGRLTREGFRTLVTSADSSAGDLVRPQYLGLLETGLQRPLTVRELLTVIPTTTDAIEYTKELSRSHAAAPVPEASQLEHTGDEDATKPEGELVFDIVSETIKQLAVWVPATKRILSDASQLKAYIDAYLTDDLALELEDQVVSGDGTGENFTGILNQDIIEIDPATGATVFDQIRKGKTQVRLQGRTNATAIMLHPVDNEKVDLQRVNNEANHYAGAGPFSADQPPIWGLRRVETEAVPEGTGLLGNYRFAALFDRESTSISVGTVDKDFIRNIVRVLAELRAGFGVIRPKAFAAVDLSTAGVNDVSA